MGLTIYSPSFVCCFSFLALLQPDSADTPLRSGQLAWELRLYPIQQQVNFVRDGVRHGFKLSFCPSQELKSAKKNEPPTTQHTSLIEECLATQVSLGRMAGPINFPPLSNL